MPLDVNEANQDVEALQRASELDRSIPSFPQTTMTCYLHLIRLKKLESEIQHDIYRVDSSNTQASVYQATDRYLERLYAVRSPIFPILRMNL